jgi:hypothetical protein
MPFAEVGCGTGGTPSFANGEGRPQLTLGPAFALTELLTCR